MDKKIPDKNFIRHLVIASGHLSLESFPPTAKWEWKHMVMYVGIELEHTQADHCVLIALKFHVWTLVPNFH